MKLMKGGELSAKIVAAVREETDRLARHGIRAGLAHRCDNFCGKFSPLHQFHRSPSGNNKFLKKGIPLSPSTGPAPNAGFRTSQDGFSWKSSSTSPAVILESALLNPVFPYA